MREELFKQSVINLLNKNEQKLSLGCIYYIMKDILNQLDKEYKKLAEKEYQEMQQKQKEVEE